MHLPDSLTYLSGFSGCTGLTTVTIPDGVTTVGFEAFCNCTGLDEIVLPQNVTVIADRALFGCTGLTTVTIGSGVKTIGSSAFRGCPKLRDVFYTGTRKQMKKIEIGYDNNPLTGALWYCKNEPIIRAQSGDKAVAIGKTVKLKVKAEPAQEGETLQYQWYYRTSSKAKWKKATGTSATETLYTFKATAKKNGYQYRCKVIGPDGYAYTSVIKLKTGNAPKIGTQPTDKSVKAKAKVKLKVEATGKSLTYQWYYRTSSKAKWKKATGTSATKATYTFTATAKKNGYQYRCLVKNPFGKVYTKAVKLKVR